MQTAPLASRQATPLPFENGQYTGHVDVSILKDQGSPARYIRVDGERITLESFQGVYSQELKRIFGANLVKDRQELKDLTAIFGSPTGMETYGSCASEDEKKILGRIEHDASRPFHGDVFTGFAVVDKETGTIIGRISLGSGCGPGESQSGLIIEDSHRRAGYAREAICLAAGLAFVFLQNGYCVGDGGDKGPVKRFTATALDSNQPSIKLITQMGMEYMRPLSARENNNRAAPRSLYGIEGEKVEEALEKLIDKHKLTWKILPVASAALSKNPTE